MIPGAILPLQSWTLIGASGSSVAGSSVAWSFVADLLLEDTLCFSESRVYSMLNTPFPLVAQSTQRSIIVIYANRGYPWRISLGGRTCSWQELVFGWRILSVASCYHYDLAWPTGPAPNLLSIPYTFCTCIVIINICFRIYTLGSEISPVKI